MDVERLKKYLQNYIDSVVAPRVNKEQSEGEEVKFAVIDILKGSYQPPIIHVFIHTKPETFVRRNARDVSHSSHKKVEKDIIDFFSLIPLNNPVKIHWNKNPFLGGKERNEFTV